jgi:hypothetical protein
MGDIVAMACSGVGHSVVSRLRPASKHPAKRWTMVDQQAPGPGAHDGRPQRLVDDVDVRCKAIPEHCAQGGPTYASIQRLAGSHKTLLNGRIC